MNSRTLILTSTAAFAACVAMAGCSPRDNTTTTTTTPNAPMTQPDNSARTGADQAATAAREAARDATDATKSAATTVGNKVTDSMITASIKAELAKNPNLSALAINVDTSNGRVTMNGTAPTDAARVQATTLAKSVKGVVDVDNKLIVSAKS